MSVEEVENENDLKMYWTKKSFFSMAGVKDNLALSVSTNIIIGVSMQKQVCSGPKRSFPPASLYSYIQTSLDAASQNVK